MQQWILTPDKYLKEPEAKQLRTFMEDKALAAYARDQKKPIRDWAIIDIALSSGLRASEIRHLRLKDLHVGKGENALLVSKGKGDKRRLVMIGEKLKKHLKEYIIWKKQQGEPADPADFLFTSERSARMTLSAVQKRFKLWSRLAGLNPRYSIHSARHTYATMLYRSTKDLRMVQKQLGHSNIRITAVYADVLAEDVEKAVNALYV
jgi:site-specific recombinase XerD